MVFFTPAYYLSMLRERLALMSILTLLLVACDNQGVTSTQATTESAARSPASQGGQAVSRPHELPPIPDPEPARELDLNESTDRLTPQGVWWWDSTSFYVVGHQDDWQLFMNPDTYADAMQENTKMVFIYTTAGDAGRRSMRPGSSYILARENGVNRAVRFMSDVGTTTHKDTFTGYTRVKGHLIHSVKYGNTVSYYLRLPDGNDGSGFDGTSLQRLYQGEIPELKAVDSSATYVGWQDLQDTIKAIMKFEAQTTGGLTLNIAETDTDLNPGDHSDHRMTSLLAEQVTAGARCFERKYFQTYHTANMPVNMTPDELMNHAALFAVTESGRADGGFPGSWETGHKAWLGKHYVRVEPALEGPPCF